jgi:hypothetical protein
MSQNNPIIQTGNCIPIAPRSKLEVYIYIKSLEWKIA